jgi:hypothetical protein
LWEACTKARSELASELIMRENVFSTYAFNQLKNLSAVSSPAVRLKLVVDNILIHISIMHGSFRIMMW